MERLERADADYEKVDHRATPLVFGMRLGGFDQQLPSPGLDSFDIIKDKDWCK